MLPQDLGTNVGLEVGKPEVAAEAYSEMGGSPREEEQEEISDTELDDGGTVRNKISQKFHFIVLVPYSSCFFHLVVHVSTSSCVLRPTPSHKPPIAGVPGGI